MAPLALEMLRVATCMSGQARTVVSTAPFIRRAMIDPIRDESDVYMALSNSSTVHVTLEDVVLLRAIFSPVAFRLFHSRWQSEGLIHCMTDIRSTESTTPCRDNHCFYRWVLRLRPDVIYGRIIPPYNQWPQWSPTDSVVYTPPESKVVAIDNRTSRWSVKDVWALVTFGARDAYFSDWAHLGIGRTANRACGWSRFSWAEGDLACALWNASVHVVALEVFPYLLVRASVGSHEGRARLKNGLQPWEAVPGAIQSYVNGLQDKNGDLNRIRWDGRLMDRQSLALGHSRG